MKMMKYVMLCFMILLLNGCSQSLHTIDDLDVEYGTPISMNGLDYLDIQKIDDKYKDKILKETKIEILDDQKVENKNYQCIGTYRVRLNYQREEKEVRVNVVDTTVPLFIDDYKKEFSYIRDCQPSKEELLKQFKVQDVDKVTLSIDDHLVDYTKEGKYEATIKAIDSSQNESIQKISIKIQKPIIELTPKKKTVFVKEKFMLETKIAGKDKKVLFESSDSSIASVSECGKVTAKKKGVVILKAKANGVEAKCELTIKNKPVTAKTEKKVVVNPVTEIVIKSEEIGEFDLDNAKKAFQLQNQKRKEAGIKELSWNQNLYNDGKIRAKEIGEKFSHTRPNGKSCFTVVSRHYKILGENIADGYKTPSSVIQGWYNSQGHKENILNNYFTSGAIIKYKNQWVALFAG
ncbi:MAG: CAP domain-containing protein [Erysipelotrichales bacterium]|nr:CAP domain-containing protein [Erysipelotrichales bacterium]